MNIVDFHTHVFPDYLAARALEKLSSRSGNPAYTDGTCSGLKRSMAKYGISRSVTVPIATKPEQTPTINSFAIQQLSDPALIPFGTLHPHYADFRTEIHRLKEAGVKGIKLHPDYQEFFVDDESMFPIYEALQEQGLIVLFHTGVDIGLSPPYHAPPNRIAKVLDRFPGLTLVAAHFGGFQMWDEVERHLIGRNLYLETSFTVGWLTSLKIVELARRHGVSKILFGTDSPWADQGIELERFNALPFTPDERTAILSTNAHRLLGLA